MKKLLLIIPMLFLLTGCYNYRELNDLAIVSGIGISMVDDEYEVTLEVVNVKKEQDSSAANQPEFVIYTSKSKSIQEAFRKVVKEAPKKVYTAQVDILIIDESVARDEISGIVDFFARDPEVRSEFYVLVGKEEDILEITTPLVNVSSTNILNSLESDNDYLGTVNLVTYHDFVSNYLNENIEIALPSIEAIGNKVEGENIDNIEKTADEATGILSTIGVFKDNKLVGYLTEEESVAFNLVMGNINTTLIETEYDNYEFIVNEIIKVDSKVDATPKDNKITISIGGKATISEANYSGNLNKSKTIQNIEDDLNKKIEEMIKENVNNVIDKYNSDIFGFADLYYKTDAKYFKEIKDKWYDEYFNNIEIEVKSNVNIFEKGNLNGGLYNGEK